MSIIIAKKEGNQSIILSDTKISINNGDSSVTGDGKLRLPPTKGVLKTHIVNKNICISFAGNIEKAQKIIFDVVKNKPTNISGFIQTMLIQFDGDPEDTDFIVNTFDNKNTHLYKITANSIEEGNSFWIGDINAFNEFQTYYNSEKNRNYDFRNRFENSFSELINSGLVSSIGDFIISSYFYNNSKAFFYGQKLELVDESFNQKLSSEDIYNWEAGNASDGAYMISNLISNDANNQAVALYFEHGKFGILFKAINENCKTIQDIQGKTYSKITITEFVNKVESDFGIILIGFSFENEIIKFINRT